MNSGYDKAAAPKISVLLRETDLPIRSRPRKPRDPAQPLLVINGGFLEGMGGYVVDAAGHNTIKAVIETLNGLVPVELDTAEFSEAV